MEGILARALGEDVSKLAAQEKQLLLSRLLARLAHEIRNPLSSLDIHVQLLEEDLAEAAPALREKTAGRLDIIHGELHRLENIVKQFLSLAGPSAVNRQPVEVGRVISHTCELLRPEASSRQIELVTDVAANIPCVVADLDQLTQALVNLLINAIQAIEKEGTISVIAALAPGGDFFTICVRDTGPGVPLGDESIFDPFFTTKEGGTGLGLWIVQQIVAAHGGMIHAGNAPGGGAVFTMHLPLSKGDGPNG